MVRKYLGDDAADHMKDFCKEHEAIKNVCDINEWMFLEDGTLFSA